MYSAEVELSNAEMVRPQMVWMDMETTGLQPPDGRPFERVLEVGAIVTDLHGNERASFRSLVLDEDWEETLESANEFVQSMHEKNGLKKELVEIETQYAFNELMPEEIDLQLRNFLSTFAGEEKIMPLVGSTINFDRYFLGKYFPESFRWFHYRNIDITTIRLLCERLAPQTYRNLPPLHGPVRHRCLDDIRASIHEYQYFKRNFLDVQI